MLLVASCSPPPPPPEESATPPATTEQGGTTTDQGGTTPSDETEGVGLSGQALVEARCTVCHSLDRVNDARLDRSGWDATVGRMIRNGAKITDQEKSAIVDYLSKRG